jgi:chromosome segregation ATPase
MKSEMQRSKLERDEIERRCSEAQNELDRLVSEKNELQTDHKKLRREFDSLEAKWAQLNNDYSSSQESLSSKTKALESTTQSVLQHKQRSEELSEEIGKLKEALRACQSALDFANEDVLKTRSADESKERMLVAKSREIETLLTEAQEMTGKMNLSQRDLAAARLEIDDLAKLKVELELSLSTIKESQAELTAAHEVIRCQYKSARDDIDRLKSELSEKDGLLEEVMKQKASMQEQVDKLSASERDLIQSNTDFQDRIKTLVNELSEARSSAETDRTHCTELTLALNSASKSRTLIETELADAMAANEDLQGRVSVLQADCEKLTADLKSSEIRLEDAQRKITRLEDLDGAKVEQNGILENQITVLQAEIRDTKNRQCELEDSLKTARSSVTSLKCSVSSLENEKAELLHEADQRKDEANGLNSEVERLKAQIETDIAQEIDLKNELDTARGMLETAKLELCEKQASINDLEAGLTSMSNMMKERNAQLDVKTSKISELEQCLATKTELEASPDLIDSLNAQVESLKNESSEVKLLLANANNEVDLARDRAVLLQRELDELELRYDFEKRSFEDAKNKSLTPELEQLRAEKAEVERALEKEVADRFQSESVWKSRLEEARKSLIEEAESHMHNLQVELRTTKESLKQAEDEAYAGRQEYQELLEREVDARAKLTELKRENDRLKSTFDQLSQDRMSESSKLATNLQVAKADETVLKKKVSDLKQKLREAIDANKKFAADSTQLKALKVTNASLRRELEAVTSSEKGSDDALAKLSDQLRVKDERIQKLEMMKFTKEHAESLKNLKVSAHAVVSLSC